MQISEQSWQGYINALRKVNDKASAEILNWLKNHGIPQNREAMNGLIDFAYAVSTTYGEAAAELAAEMYEATAALSGVIIEPAVPAATPEIGEVAKTVVGTAKLNNEEILSAAIGRLVKQTGVDTTMQNALRDGAEWVRRTCPFVLKSVTRLPAVFSNWRQVSKFTIHKRDFVLFRSLCWIV